MALHGQNQYVIFEPLPGPVRVGGGERGTYKVVFTLSRPGFAIHPEGNFKLHQELDGDSHLYIRTAPETSEIVLALSAPQDLLTFTAYPTV